MRSACCYECVCERVSMCIGGLVFMTGMSVMTRKLSEPHISYIMVEVLMIGNMKSTVCCDVTDSIVWYTIPSVLKDLLHPSSG
jgi:hypothetical protein